MTTVAGLSDAWHLVFALPLFHFAAFLFSCQENALQWDETLPQPQPSICGCAALQHPEEALPGLGRCAPRQPWQEELVGAQMSKEIYLAKVRATVMVNLHTPMSTTSSCQPHHQVQSAKYPRDCAESSISRKKAKRLSGRGSSGCARRRLRVRNGIDPMARPCCAGLQMEVTKRAQKSIRDAVALLLWGIAAGSC